MKIALLHNHYEADHLAAVTKEMQSKGAPTIKAVWVDCYGVWAAIEGCHRLRAAHSLGLLPVIEEITCDGDTTLCSLGVDCQDDDTIEDIIDRLPDAKILSWDE